MANKPDDNSVFHFTVFDQVSITYRLFIGIVQAAIYKHRHSMVHVKLPEIKTPQTYKQEALDSLIHQVMTKIDTLVKLSIHFTTRKCFFRSYAAACVLRRYGIGVALNMGLHHLNKKHQRVRGHCWLTLQGRPIAEKVNPESTSASISEEVERIFTTGSAAIRRTKTTWCAAAN